MYPLPIDAHIPEILTIFEKEPALVLSAPPGAGKTTRIPRALYDAGFARNGEILILEPRRLAARLAAAHVAQELGERLGETVGYSIRFENVAGPKTRIRFLTEAILARRMVHDPYLEGVSAVILDEFHERHIAIDLALSFLKRLQTKNTGPKTIVMSATLDVKAVSSFLGGAPILSLSHAPHDVSIAYEERNSDRPLHEKVASAVAKLAHSDCMGDILVFLPGAAEIHRSAEALKQVAESRRLVVCALHGDLSSSEQRRAIERAERQKVILSTNVAETSITISGIAAVIDSGLARIAGHSPWSGFPTLSTLKISKSSAKQRAGRAGRMQAGCVLRLYTRSDYESRPEHEAPEIKRIDLAETALLLHGSGIRDLHTFPWFEAPPKSAIEAAETLLAKLGAVDRQGRITDVGRQTLPLPIHPRLARLVVECRKRNVAAEGVLLAALLSERDIRLSTRTRFSSKTSKAHAVVSGESDLLELVDCFRLAEISGFAPEQVSALGLDPGAIQAVRRGERQLQRFLSVKRKDNDRMLPAEADQALLIAILAAFPDRVCKRRDPNARELLLAGGGSALLSTASVVHHPRFAVAVDAEERREGFRKDSGIIIRLASSIEAKWLAELFPEEIVQKGELAWNDRARRVDEFRRTFYGQITIEEREFPAAPCEQASQILAAVVLAKHLAEFSDWDSFSSFKARLSLIARYFPDENFQDVAESQIEEMVSTLCRGKTRLEDLAKVSLVGFFAAGLTSRQRFLLERETPERVKLKSGRAVKIHYDPMKPPWIESRLQDFFGMSMTPSICSTRVPLTVHLLAPSGRAVQVTSDLAGFWKRHYPSIRKELQRRYPKHSWPEI